MKFTADRQEKKGPFGGTYYELYIRVTLEPKEEEIARKQGIMSKQLVGTNNPDSSEFTKMIQVCGKSSLSMIDLTSGITAKASDGSQIGKLAWFEQEVREACKTFKSHIIADGMFGSGGKKIEEEI
ncbi:MAG: hypothetical protein U7127_22420 [Phormidium sp.]